MMELQHTTHLGSLRELPPGAAYQPQSVTSQATGTLSVSVSWFGERTLINRWSVWYQTCHSPAIERAICDNTYSS